MIEVRKPGVPASWTCYGCGAAAAAVTIAMNLGHVALCRSCAQRLVDAITANLHDPDEIDFPFERPTRMVATGMREAAERVAMTLKPDTTGRETCRACKGEGVVAVEMAGETGSGENVTDEDCDVCEGRGWVEEGGQDRWRPIDGIGGMERGE